MKCIVVSQAYGGFKPRYYVKKHGPNDYRATTDIKQAHVFEAECQAQIALRHHLRHPSEYFIVRCGSKKHAKIAMEHLL